MDLSCASRVHTDGPAARGRGGRGQPEPLGHLARPELVPRVATRAPPSPSPVLRRAGRRRRRLCQVSCPSDTATTRPAPRPGRSGSCGPASASVNRSPGSLLPTVTTTGATPSPHSATAWSSRAANTEVGVPSYWLAPRTTMASTGARSSCRATHHTRPATLATHSPPTSPDQDQHGRDPTQHDTTAAPLGGRHRGRLRGGQGQRLSLSFHGDGGPAGLEPGDRDPERRARHVVETRPRGRSGPTSGSPPCSPQTPRCRSGRAARPSAHGHADQGADAVDVDGLERARRRRCRPRGSR